MSPTSGNALFCLSLFFFSVSIVSSRIDMSLFSFINNTSTFNRSSRSLFNDVLPSIEYLGAHAGYISIPSIYREERMFYYFFNERSPINSPVAIWLTGIPGLASSVSLFRENGPFRINNDLSLRWNDYGWDKELNIIFVDEPLGTCFSYSNLVSRPKTLIVNDLYNFLQVFFRENAGLRSRPFLILGQSYAGSYGSDLAYLILTNNDDERNIRINLRGIAIGNGFVSPKKQFRSIPLFLKNNGLLIGFVKTIERLSNTCQLSIEACESSRGIGGPCLTAYEECQKLLDEISRNDINTYNLKIKPFGRLHYNFSDVESFLNTEGVRGALRVRGSNRIEIFNSRVYETTVGVGEMMKNAEQNFVSLLEDNVHVLIYAGERDIECNWMGNLEWVSELEWKGQAGFKENLFVSLLIDNVASGSVKGHGALNFASIYDAGHMMSMDEPTVAFGLLQMWTNHIKVYG